MITVALKLPFGGAMSVSFEEVFPGIWTAGSSQAPPLLMLHGWGGTGPSNFSFSVEVLSRDWHMVAIDLAGHGHGTRLKGINLSAEDLAEDVREKMGIVGLTSATVAGYSLGGAVAQALWHNHCDTVEGLILAGTATRLSPTPIANAALHGWAATSGLAGPAWGALGAGIRTVLQVGANRGIGVTNISGVAEHDGPAVQLLARSIANFNSGPWIREVDVPVGVMVCLNDRLVPTRRQSKLAEMARAVKTIEVPGGHLGFLRHPEIFAVAFRELASSVYHAAHPTVPNLEQSR